MALQCVACDVTTLCSINGVTVLAVTAVVGDTLEVRVLEKVFSHFRVYLLKRVEDLGVVIFGKNHAKSSFFPTSLASLECSYEKIYEQIRMFIRKMLT